jgi:hypothetical protein
LFLLTFPLLCDIRKMTRYTLVSLRSVLKSQIKDYVKGRWCNESKGGKNSTLMLQQLKNAETILEEEL